VTSKRKIRNQLAGDRETAFHDARRLALDLARSQSSIPFDPMHAGVVLQPGEVAYRQVPALFSQLSGHGLFGWTDLTPVTVLLTDRRALMRWPDGSLISLWWKAVQGFEASRHNETVILDYGDGNPRCLSGPTVPVIAVAGIAGIYGVGAMLRHPAMASLRAQGYRLPSTLEQRTEHAALGIERAWAPLGVKEQVSNRNESPTAGEAVADVSAVL
jgi:hypothetical protein